VALPRVPDYTDVTLSGLDNLSSASREDNLPLGGEGYGPVRQQLLPFDGDWLRELARRTWPTQMIPQVLPVATETLAALLRRCL
jgi:hypothetical protein